MKTVRAPTRQAFVEARVGGPISIEFRLPDCRVYDSYLIWVGPWGENDTGRQPTTWEVFVRPGLDREWAKADEEHQQVS